MSSGRAVLGARFLAGLKFWSIVGVACAVVAVIGFRFGRDYVGGHLHSMEVEQRVPNIQPQSRGASLPAGDDPSSDPPVQAVVAISEREPTAREERTALRELENPSPQRSAGGGGENSSQDADSSSGGEEALGDSEAEAAGSREGKFIVTAGAFADQVNAERQAQRLAESGYRPYITTIEKDGVTYRRVNVGVFDSRDQADELSEKLKSQGFDAAVGAG